MATAERCSGCEVGVAASTASSLQRCRRCKRYFTFDTETKVPNAPCRFHSGKFSVYGGQNGGTLAYGGLPPYWRCCGAQGRDAPGCKVLSHHVQDDAFLDVTADFSGLDRPEVVKDWPPVAVQGGASSSASPADGKAKAKELLKGWVEVRVTRDDTVPKLAVRYGCNPVLFRALNKLPNDMMLMSRNTVLVPPHDPDVTPPPPPETEDEIRAKKVRQLMRAGHMSMEEAKYHLAAADSSLERALWDYRTDLAWEQTHAKGKSPALARPRMI